MVAVARRVLRMGDQDRNVPSKRKYIFHSTLYFFVSARVLPASAGLVVGWVSGRRVGYSTPIQEQDKENYYFSEADGVWTELLFSFVIGNTRQRQLFRDDGWMFRKSLLMPSAIAASAAIHSIKDIMTSRSRVGY